MALICTPLSLFRKVVREYLVAVYICMLIFIAGFVYLTYNWLEDLRFRKRVGSQAISIGIVVVLCAILTTLNRTLLSYLFSPPPSYIDYDLSGHLSACADEFARILGHA